jgi:hypothetical protein
VWIDCLAKQLELTGVCYEEQVVFFKVEHFLIQGVAEQIKQF